MNWEADFKFDIEDLNEFDVISTIKIFVSQLELILTQLNYTDKIHKKFNRFNDTSALTRLWS